MHAYKIHSSVLKNNLPSIARFKITTFDCGEDRGISQIIVKLFFKCNGLNKHKCALHYRKKGGKYKLHDDTA